MNINIHSRFLDDHDDQKRQNVSFLPNPAHKEPVDSGDEGEAKTADYVRADAIRKSLGLESLGAKKIRIADTGKGVTEFDMALGGFVLNDAPDRIVSDILKQIPTGLGIVDNGLSDIEKNIRIWLTESAGNSARHISYRRAEDGAVNYEIGVYCRIIMKHGGTYFEISMQDNGVGIPPENLAKIGEQKFTTSALHVSPSGTLHPGGHGRFSVDFKHENAHPREWEMSISNRDDGEKGAVSYLIIPLRSIEELRRAA